MALTISPNMNLPIPGVGTEAGPTYAFDVNDSLTLIDTHDHTPGRGVQITPAGLNINVNLPFNNNAATNLLEVVLNAQSAATDTLQALSVAPGSEITPLQDLWYTDSAGNKVQITDNGALAAVSTTVQGISYALGTFSFDQTQDGFPTTPANLDAGSVTIRPNTAMTPFGVRLVPNGGISSQYDLTLPLPIVATSFVTQDPSGVLAGTIPVSGGITQSNMANNSIGTAQIIDANVTEPKLADNSVSIRTLVPIISQSNSFGPTNIPSISIGWYLLANNSITLPTGQWRLTGNVGWNSTGNQVNGLQFGLFGANGNNTNTLPTAIIGPTIQSGRIGAIPSLAIVGTNALYHFANIPETIITVSAPTATIYLNMKHETATGTNVQYQGSIFAEKIRD